MTALIGAVYLAGAAELLRFEQGTAALSQALAAIPENLAHPGEWLRTLPPALQNPVRLRIEGERVGLPGPAVTPYLVGLLVLLGMLGTFLGMVVTLNGAVLALESTTDLQTIRASLAAPVKGLGVAFGTSVAGVAASAMLGLLSAMSRRTRAQADNCSTPASPPRCAASLVQQRLETFKALQQQADALPAVVPKLDAMMLQLEHHSVQINERLLAEQGASTATRGTCTHSWPARSATLSGEPRRQRPPRGRDHPPGGRGHDERHRRADHDASATGREHRTDSARRTRRSLRHHGCERLGYLERGARPPRAQR